MPALVQPDILKRALSDPNAAAAELVYLVARKSKKTKGKSKIKGGAIAGIIIAIIVIIIIAAIIFLLYKRKQKKRLQSGH